MKSVLPNIKPKQKHDLFVEKLNKFDRGLIYDNECGFQNFRITIKDIPLCLSNHSDFPVQRCDNVQQLVVQIRNWVRYYYFSL